MSPHPPPGRYRRRRWGPPPLWAWAAGAALLFVIGFGGWIGAVQLWRLAHP